MKLVVSGYGLGSSGLIGSLEPLETFIGEEVGPASGGAECWGFKGSLYGGKGDCGKGDGGKGAYGVGYGVYPNGNGP